MSKTDEERMAEFVSKQVDRVRDQIKDFQSETESKFTHLDRKSDEKIKLESLKLERKEEVPFNPTHSLEIQEFFCHWIFREINFGKIRMSNIAIFTGFRVPRPSI